MSSKTKNLTLTYEYVTIKRDPLLSTTNHSNMFSNFIIKSVLSNEHRQSKIDADFGHKNLKINNDYLLSSGNHYTKFSNYQANVS